MTAADPRSHEAHEMPLAERIMERAIRDWLDRRTATALATTGDLNDCERGQRQGIEGMRYLHLDDYSYTVVPEIIGQMRRAGLITQEDPPS